MQVGSILKVCPKFFNQKLECLTREINVLLAFAGSESTHMVVVNMCLYSKIETFYESITYDVVA